MDSPARPTSLPRLPYARLRFTLTAREPARLPAYLGSTLRGAWGHALRAISCTMGPDQPCGTCPRRQGCVYSRLFETLSEGEAPPFLQRVRTPPRPYVVEPRENFAPEANERLLAEGDAVAFDLLLLGTALPLAPFAMLAVDRMAELGLGVRRQRFRLETTATLAEDGGWRPLGLGAPAEVAGRVGEAPQEGEPPERLRLHFLTPARLLDSGERVGELKLRDLAFRMLRRLYELAHFFGAREEIDWHFRPLLSALSHAELQCLRLRWVELDRYSNRQQTKMTLGGFIGSLELAGELAPLWPLVKAAEIVHLGKGATFGLGRVRVEEM